MKTAAIIAEYNPFHSGHKYHIDATRAEGATHIISIMSGSLVQRGEFSAFSKHTRAHAALLNGADLVLELPCIYSLSSAQRFAEGAVRIVNRLGISDILSFGSECGDITKLDKAADALIYLDNSQMLADALSEGISYPNAKQKALTQLIGDSARIMEKPNNTLAIEYLCALKRLKAENITPISITRTGVEHDSDETLDNIASASRLRNMISENQLINNFIPENSIRLYQNEIEEGHYQIDPLKFEIAMLYALKSFSKQDFESLPDVSEGLHNRLYSSAQTACTLEEFYTLTKTKRYTFARIRRISLYALLGINKNDLLAPPKYIHVLGMNEKGKQLLALARKTSQIPYITAFSKASNFCERTAYLDAHATDLHSFLSRKPLPCGQDYYNNAIIVD